MCRSGWESCAPQFSLSGLGHHPEGHLCLASGPGASKQPSYALTHSSNFKGSVGGRSALEPFALILQLEI